MAENEVKMYPTLKWFVKGEAFKYKGNNFGEVIVNQRVKVFSHSNYFPQGIATWVKKALNNDFELVKDTSKTFQQMKKEADIQRAQEEAEIAKALAKEQKAEDKKSEKAEKKDKKAKKAKEEPKEEIPDDVLDLTDENIEAALKDHKYLLVQFYAPWCGHCKKMGPGLNSINSNFDFRLCFMISIFFFLAYKKAAQLLKDEGHVVKIARLDATKETVSKKKYKAGGYPTLRFFVNGEPYKYGGSREEDVSIKFCITKLPK